MSRISEEEFNERDDSKKSGYGIVLRESELEKINNNEVVSIYLDTPAADEGAVTIGIQSSEAKGE